MLRLCFLSIFVGRIKILTFHIDIAYYFRHNPLTLAEAEARGLLPKTRAGEQTAASRIGLTVAANAGDNTFILLVNGKCTAEDAYIACLIATTEEGQQLALETRAGKNGKKNSWEYVTALVRSAEQMQPADGGMLNLFGNDESFRESSEKLARYVAAVREGLKARISIFVNSSKLNRKADVAKELGVKVNTPEDATRLISRLASLDAAYERLDPDLGIPAKAEAWDGKSAVPTKLDELAAGSSFSLVGGVQFAARTGADKFAPDANGKEPVLAVNVKAMRADGSEAKKNDDVYVCPTPDVMQMVGALPLDMVMSYHVLAKVLDENTLLGNGQTTGKMYVKEKDMGKHHLTVDELRKLPLALANPVCIAVSNRKGCVEVITDMEENGVNVLVAVQLDVASGSKYINVNRIASLYGKEKIDKLVQHPMLYVNTAKAHRWMVVRGLQLPTKTKLSAGSNGRVLTPEDLVKYKMEKSLSFALEPYTPAELAEGFLRRQSHGHRILRRMAAYMRNQARRYRLLYPRMPKDTQAALQAIADAQALILYSLRLYIPYKFFKRRESVWQGHFLQSLNHGKQIPPAIFLFFSLPRQP